MTRLATMLVCVFVAGAQSSVVAAQERQLFLLVTDQSGQPVLDMQPDEVRVGQQGTECRILSLNPESNGMKVALLVDNSEPASRSLNPLRDGLRAFLEKLPPDHQVGLYTIAGQTRQLVSFTTNREALVTEAERLFVRSGGGAVLLDGLVETWNRRFSEEDSWPVFVLVIHDGPEASGSVQTDEFNAFVRELMARGATTHAILISERGGGLQASVSMNITQNTGGIYRELLAPTALPAALSDLANTMGANYDEVKNRYRVVFACDPDDPLLPLNVAVSRPAVTVRLFANRRLDQ